MIIEQTRECWVIFLVINMRLSSLAFMNVQSFIIGDSDSVVNIAISKKPLLTNIGLFSKRKTPVIFLHFIVRLIMVATIVLTLYYFLTKYVTFLAYMYINIDCRVL